MWTTILKILSILGWILLGILIFLLSVLILSLFLPIVYRVDLKASDGNYSAKAKFHYFLGFINGWVQYPGNHKGKNIRVNLLCFPVFQMSLTDEEAQENTKEPAKEYAKDLAKEPAEESAKEASRKTAEESNEKEDTSIQPNEAMQMQDDVTKHQDDIEVGIDEEIDVVTKETADKDTADKDTPSDLHAEEAHCESDDTFEKVQNNNNNWFYNCIALIKTLPKKIKQFLYKINEVYDKIRLIWGDISFYIRLWEDEDTQLFLAKIKKRFGKILKWILPRSIKGNITVGTGEPDTTGLLYGVYAMWHSRYGKKVIFNPDFEQKKVEGHLTCKGHFILLPIAFIGLITVFSKHVKRLKMRMQKHESLKQRKQIIYEKERRERFY